MAERFGDRVTIEMSRDDYERLIWLIACATGRIVADFGMGKEFWCAIALANRLFGSQPGWASYEIPPEYQQP